MHIEDMDQQSGSAELFPLLQGVPRLTDLLSRLRFDYRLLLDESNYAAVAAAAGSCRSCEHTKACDRWRAQHAEGEDNSSPWFCPALTSLGLVRTPSLPLVPASSTESGNVRFALGRKVAK